MSAISGTGSGSGKQGEDEITMKDLFKCLTTIEGVVVPMSEHLTSMEETVADQGKQQTTLHVALTNVEHNLQNTGRGYNTSNAPDHDDEPGQDGFQTSHKIEFPKFDGTGDRCRG
jgi:hypothetical protein